MRSIKSADIGPIPQPTRHVIFEKRLPVDVANAKYIFAPGGSFWTVDINQCHINQWIFQCNSDYKYDVIFSQVSNNNSSAFTRQVVENALDKYDKHLSAYVGDRNSLFFSSLRKAEECLCIIALPPRIEFYKKRILDRNVSADKKYLAKIQLGLFKNKLKHLKRKLNG